eukprot:s3873_g6.t1
MHASVRFKPVFNANCHGELGAPGRRPGPTMAEQLELSDLSWEQMKEIILRTQRQQSLTGDKDVVKAAASVVRKASEKLEAEISEASQRAAVVKSVDACFVLDCTGSMSDKIQAAKKKIVEIQRRIVGSLGHGGNVRFSVVGYRDHYYSTPFEILPLTKDVKEVEFFLSRLWADKDVSVSDADVCEDVIGALSHAMDPRAASIKDIQKYDNFPDGADQWGTTDRIMAKSVALNLNFVLLEYVWNICFLLGTTFQVFSDLRQASSPATLQTLHLRPENTADDFVQCILSSTKETLSKTLTRPMSNKSGARSSGCSGTTLSLEVKADVCWKDCKNWPVDQVLVTAVNVIAVTSAANPSRTIHRLHIRKEPFASGSMRYAFPATSSDGIMRFVLKVHKDASQSVSSVTLADVKTQAYAKMFAEEFSQRFPAAPLQFLDAWAIELPRCNIAAVMCPSCKEKVKESLATTRCMSCEQPFTYSMYNISLKGAAVPPVCRSCEQGEETTACGRKWEVEVMVCENENYDGADGPPKHLYMYVSRKRP